MAQNENSRVTYAGWVFKEGSLVKSWKKRFLVVKRNELAYYKNTEQENKAQILGAMTVARVEKAPDITNGLLIMSVEGRQLKIFTDTQKECDKCFNAIAQHASDQRGGSAVTPLLDFGKSAGDHISHVGWLEKEGQHFKTWKKRYFMLEENVLSYTAQIGSPSLGKARVIAARRDLSRPNTLVVMMEGGRELRIGGKTEAEIHEWHKAMRRAIQRYGGRIDNLTSPVGGGHANLWSQRSPALRSPAYQGTATPPQRSPPPGYMLRSPVGGNYPQPSPPPPSYDTAVGSQADSPLFGSLPEDEGKPPMPTFDAEQTRNMAARQNREMFASFRKHIILEPTPDNSTSFIECEDPEKKKQSAPAAKPYSPKAPGANTILKMRLEDQLLLEELEEERVEAMQKEKEKALHGQDPAPVNAPCCCIVM
uniref:PH domain-containing protein n=1 Tax=Globisporangium ultimum (strain ATCC 200006 / CBS 805.95 / DAOM BR144) TaxID=431595 RepID=K3X6N6_GLOUD